MSHARILEEIAWYYTKLMTGRNNGTHDIPEKCGIFMVFTTDAWIRGDLLRAINRKDSPGGLYDISPGYNGINASSLYNIRTSSIT